MIYTVSSSMKIIYTQFLTLKTWGIWNSLRLLSEKKDKKTWSWKTKEKGSYDKSKLGFNLTPTSLIRFWTCKSSGNNVSSYFCVLNLSTPFLPSVEKGLVNDCAVLIWLLL